MWDRDRWRLERRGGWGGERISTWLLQTLALDLLLQLLAFLLWPAKPRINPDCNKNRTNIDHRGGETVETIWIGWMILKLPGVELMVSGSSWSTSFLLPCSPFLRTLKLRGVAVTMNGSGSSKLSSMAGMISSNFWGLSVVICWWKTLSYQMRLLRQLTSLPGNLRVVGFSMFSMREMMLKSSSAPLCDFFPRGRPCRGNGDQQRHLDIPSIILLIIIIISTYMPYLLWRQLQRVLRWQIVVTRILSISLKWLHTRLEVGWTLKKDFKNANLGDLLHLRFLESNIVTLALLPQPLKLGGKRRGHLLCYRPLWLVPRRWHHVGHLVVKVPK